MALDILRPFTRGQAIAAGLTDRQLRGKGFVRLLGGVYISAKAKDHALERARAAVHLVHPAGAVGTHLTSARVRRVPVPANPLEHVTVSRPEDRRQRHGLRCHVAALAAEETQVVRGVRISAPAAMFVELASLLGLVDLVVAGDWLVRQEHLTCEELVHYCTKSHDPYAEAARRAASYVREGVDSPMETRLRMLLVLAGLPEPEVNFTIHDDDGVVRMRLDLSYPRVRLAVEYDGRQHIEDITQWEHDPERRDELEDSEWRVLVVTSKGIYREPERTIFRVRRALRARGYGPLPPASDDWRPYFRADRRQRSVA